MAHFLKQNIFQLEKFEMPIGTNNNYVETYIEQGLNGILLPKLRKKIVLVVEKNF